MKRALLLIVILCSPGLIAVDMSDPQIINKINRVVSAGQPEFFNDVILFTYTSPAFTRYVGVAFSHEDFTVVHPFYKNQNGVFFCLIDIPKNLPSITYRYMIDSVWRTDPFNSKQQSDRFGTKLSFLTLPVTIRLAETNPRINADKSATFTFYGNPGMAVSIAGDFNNWDPFFYQLTEISPGKYQATFNVTSGKHFYYYIANGSITEDYLNIDFIFDSRGIRIYFFTAG